LCPLLSQMCPHSLQIGPLLFQKSADFSQKFAHSLQMCPLFLQKNGVFFFNFLNKKQHKSRGLFLMLKKRAKLLNFTGMESTVGHSGFTKIAEYYHSFFKN